MGNKLTVNAYADFIKENLKNKLSNTEQFNAYLKDTTGYSADVDSGNFYGASILASANDAYGDLVVDYQDTLAKSKNNYSRGIVGNAEAYRDAAINYNTSFQKNQNAYGTVKESLAGGGLIGSGYEKYLSDNVYKEYVAALNILNNTKKQSDTAYENAYSQYVGAADLKLDRGAKSIANSAYNALAGQDQAYKDAYAEELANYESAYANPTGATKIADIESIRAYIGDDKAYEYIGKAQEKNYELLMADIKTATESGDATAIANAWATLDANRANVSEEQYSKAYYDKVMQGIAKENIKSVGDWDIAKAEIDARKSKLGSFYDKAIAELNKIDRNSLAKTDAQAAVAEYADTLSEIIPPKQVSQGLQNIATGGATTPDQIAEWIKQGKEKIAENRVTNGHTASNGTAYTTIDSSTKYDIANASLTIGENITIKIGDKETKANLRYYATKSTKEALKGMQVGEVKEHNGYLYLQGKNSLFRLDKSDTQALIDAGYFK
jgi:hypothetical protein